MTAYIYDINVVILQCKPICKIVTTIYVTAGFQTSDWFFNRSTGLKTGQVNFKSVRYTQSQKASQKAGQ